uniref:Uncharacterized protein n=1 Tax=Lotharella oceanica TaxID=641309 RepID=A0A7S2TRR1_9EUKA|mmetsp:Transcript_24290/g.45450  ORF Transcript_24290/g.45450 Transcript_24290/m.45450 type:complete len:159 (+) Transcript_24290:2-478(+)
MGDGDVWDKSKKPWRRARRDAYEEWRRENWDSRGGIERGIPDDVWGYEEWRRYEGFPRPEDVGGFDIRTVVRDMLSRGYTPISIKQIARREALGWNGGNNILNTVMNEDTLKESLVEPPRVDDNDHGFKGRFDRCPRGPNQHVELPLGWDQCPPGMAG